MSAAVVTSMPFTRGSINYTPQVTPAIVLSGEQRQAIDAIFAAAREGGRFLFVTGKAGTGKSTILKSVRGRLLSVVMAPTGLAALNVGGVTIHRFFGFDIKLRKSKDQVAGLHGSKAKLIQKMMREGGVLIIDEISMVRVDLMDRISWCLQKTTGIDRPFGGLTVVAFGDMWQLEPVPPNRKTDKGIADDDFLRQEYKSLFWFDSHSAKPQADLLGDGLQIEIHNLEEVFRQKGDPEFIDALNLIRTGDPAGLEYINRRAGIPAPDGVVQICFTNPKCDMTNGEQLSRIAGDAVTFQATVSGDIKKGDFPAPEELDLKVGARVMVTKNITADDGFPLVNGDLGEVVDFNPHPVIWTDSGRLVTITRETWEEVDTVLNLQTDKKEERVVATFTQYPLKLAWAITAHKSQGQTYDTANLTLEREAFAHGQLYVALSRVRSMDGLYIRRPMTRKDLNVNPRVRQVFGASVVDLEVFG